MATRAPIAEPSERRTQQERRETTQRALLDATVGCLVERGYAATTPAAICERAGLSRSAHLHHFGSRAALVSAGVAHLGRRIADDLHANAAALPKGRRRDRAALDLLWDAFSGELFRTALDIWAAARTDPALMEALGPVEHELDRDVMTLCIGLFPRRAEDPDFEPLMDFVLSTIRGLALLSTVQPSDRTAAERWPFARARLLEMLSAD
jgi:AcrR family transcriptional regulator